VTVRSSLPGIAALVSFAPLLAASKPLDLPPLPADRGR
jgi:hypothetical protein